MFGAKRKIIIISITFGLLAIALVIFAGYLLSDIKKNSKDIISISKDIAAINSQTDKSEQIKEFFKKLEPDLEKSDKLFVNPELPIDLIRYWEKIAKDVEITIDISPISSKEETGKDIWKSLQFQLSLAGSFPRVLKFLEKIETGSYLMGIQNLNVKRFSQEELRGEKRENLLTGDVIANVLVKVYAK